MSFLRKKIVMEYYKSLLTSELQHFCWKYFNLFVKIVQPYSLTYFTLKLISNTRQLSIFSQILQNFL